MNAVRKDWNEFWVGIAELFAQQSTCARVQVGAVLVRDNRALSTGYNGVPSGLAHCIDYFKRRKEAAYPHLLWDEYTVSSAFYEEHHAFAVEREVHAETNAVLFAAREGIATNHSTLYATHSPCSDCAKMLLVAGVERVFYRIEYDRDHTGLEFLAANNILCQKV